MSLVFSAEIAKGYTQIRGSQNKEPKNIIIDKPCASVKSSMNIFSIRNGSRDYAAIMTTIASKRQESDILIINFLSSLKLSLR